MANDANDELFGGDNLIEFDLHYSVDKNKGGISHVKILTDDEAAKLKADAATKDSVKTLRTGWIQMTWQAANELLRRSMTFNFQTNQNDIDFTMYRDARLKASLIQWDAKDKTGAPVPCNEHSINKLHANVAMALLDKYDKLTSVEKDEQQKN